MAAFKGIDLGGVFYSSSQLKKDGLLLSDASEDKLEKQIFTFCFAWLSDQCEFTVQTSGSTGEPKQIILTRAQMENSALLTGQALDLKPGDQALMCLSPNYIAGIMMLVRAMIFGLDLTVAPPVSNPFSINSLRHRTFDFTALVPLQLHTIMQHGDAKCLNAMKAVLVGGADVSNRLINDIQQLKCAVYHTFGMTETASHIALRPLNGEDVSPHFRVLPGITLGQDKRGCLTIRGAVTNHEILITNDIVELISTETFRWLGRADNVINSGGIKIFPEEVEQKISKILAAESLNFGDFLVIGIPDERLGHCAAVVFEGPVLCGEQRRRFGELLEQGLESYQRPRAVFNLSKFVRYPNGKIDRQQTRALLPYTR